MVKAGDPQALPAAPETVNGATGNPDDRPAPGLGIPDDRILGEISHEMGNYFHKLYYWTDYLKERHAHGGETDAGAVEMLEGTVKRLERFMRMALEYFAPARVSFTRIRATELIAGLESRLVGRRMRVVGSPALESIMVLADAGLIGDALRTVVESLATTLIDEDELVVRLVEARLRDFRGLEIAFEAGKATPAGKALARGIEMAVAEKFIQMHGGEMYERSGGVAGRVLVVFLPIYS